MYNANTLKEKRMLKIKKTVSGLLIFVMLFMVGCAKTEEDVKAEDVVEKIDYSNVVAVVNAEVVTIDDFNKHYDVYAKMYTHYYGDDYLEAVNDGVKNGDRLKADIFNMLVQMALIRDFVFSNGFKVDQDVIQEEYAKLEAQLAEDEETRQFNQKIGVDEPFLKKDIEMSLIYDAFKEMVLNARGDELNKLYDQYAVKVKVRHILVDDPVLALEIKQQLDEGSDFAELVSEHSKDTGSVPSGGSIGFIPRGTMIGEFENTAFALEVGQISEPVQTVYGYHIIQSEAVQTVNDLIANGEDESNIEAYKNEIKEMLYSLYYSITLSEVEAKANVETFFEKVAK